MVAETLRIEAAWDRWGGSGEGRTLWGHPAPFSRDGPHPVRPSGFADRSAGLQYRGIFPKNLKAWPAAGMPSDRWGLCGARGA